MLLPPCDASTCSAISGNKASASTVSLVCSRPQFGTHAGCRLPTSAWRPTYCDDAAVNTSEAIRHPSTKRWVQPPPPVLLTQHGPLRAVLLEESTKRATCVNMQLPRLQKDLRTGSISRDIGNFPAELCGRRSVMFNGSRTFGAA